MKQTNHWPGLACAARFFQIALLNCEFSLVRKATYEKMEKENPKEYGKDQNSHRDYGFFNYNELSPFNNYIKYLILDILFEHKLL